MLIELDYNGKPIRNHTAIFCFIRKILIASLICILGLKVVLVFITPIYVFDFFDVRVFFMIYLLKKLKPTFKKNIYSIF